MYNYEIELVDKVTTKDGIGNDVVVELKRPVLAGIADVGGFEFYNAKVAGLKPEIKFIIKTFEYLGEKEVIFEDMYYKVTRTYTVGFEDEGYKNRLKFDEIELTCEKL